MIKLPREHWNESGKDELLEQRKITAHRQKLDALKKHKKGLMQQLFPSTHEE